MPVLAAARQTVLEHHHRADVVGSLQVTHVVALDAQRRPWQLQVLGQLVQRPSPAVVVAATAQPVPRKRLACIVPCRVHQRALVAPLRDAQRHPGTTLLAQPLLVQRYVRRQFRNEHELGPSQRVLLVIQPREHTGDELRSVECLHLVHDEPSLAHHPPLAHEEQLDGRFQLVVADADYVEVLVAGPSELLFLDGTPDAGEPIPQPGRQLELELGRRIGHALGEIVDDRVGIAFEEAHQFSDEPVIFVAPDLSHARPCALLDVVQQARPANPLVGGQLVVAARADRERPQQQVERLADRVGVPVGSEVPVAALAPTAHDHGARPLVEQGHRQKRVRLVVAQPHVESRLVPLDEAVLEHERLDLSRHLDPLDGRSRGDHLRGTKGQAGGIAEVAVQAGSKALRLAHVDDPPVRV